MKSVCSNRSRFLQTLFVVHRGVSGCLFLGREQFPFRDTRNFAEKGVSLHGTLAEWQFPVRDTGDFAEKGVSLHRTSVFLYPAVAIQVFPLERVCRSTELQKERRFPSAIQGILRKRVCRGMEPLHGASARSLCTNPLRRTAARAGRKVGFCFLLSEGACSELFLKRALG